MYAVCGCDYQIIRFDQKRMALFETKQNETEVNEL